jgi:hypothetical protein
MPGLPQRSLVYLLSAGIHCAAVVTMVELSPDRIVAPIEHQVRLLPPEPRTIVDTPRPVLPDPVPEGIADDTVLAEGTPLVESQAPLLDEPDGVESRERGTASSPAFDATQWNLAIGPGGGAGGPGSRYSGRTLAGPSRVAGRPYAESIDAGLSWLKAHQDADGRWDCDRFMKHDDATCPPCDGGGSAMHDIGVTGLSLLAFLGDGSTARSGTYKEQIKRAVKWLCEQQQPNGRFGAAETEDFIYDHAIATYAMCEAFGLSDSQVLRESAQRAVDHLESHRNPGAAWRYRPHDGNNDTSVTGWCVMALESGRSFGLRVDPAMRQEVTAWLDQVADPSGRHGYSTRGELGSRKSGAHAMRFPPERSEALTAVGLLTRIFLGQDDRTEPLLRAAAERLRRSPPVWDARSGAVDHYYWYHATHALFQLGGPAWTEWQKHLEVAVVKTQHRDRQSRNLYGSWAPDCVWGADGGRVYSTALLTLTLQAHYRYTRLLR